jgi:hypothetical protein
VEVIEGACKHKDDTHRSDYDQLGGLGLDLVEHISTRWGMHERTPHVWFELELSEASAIS